MSTIELSLTEIVVSGAAVVGGTLFALIKWQLTREVRRVDRHGEDIDQLKREKVDHTEMQNVVNRLSDQTTVVLKKVDDSVLEARERGREIHTRIDEMGRSNTQFQMEMVKEVTTIAARADSLVAKPDGND